MGREPEQLLRERQMIKIGDREKGKERSRSARQLIPALYLQPGASVTPAAAER